MFPIDGITLKPLRKLDGTYCQPMQSADANVNFVTHLLPTYNGYT
jgi:hypothetical protein